MGIRVGAIRLGRNFSATIFIICVIEMVIYINMCMTEEVGKLDKATTETFIQREKENMSMFAIPSPNEKAEAEHRQHMEQAHEALKREALTKEVENEERLLEKQNEQLEGQQERRPLPQRFHYAEAVTNSESSDGEADGANIITASSFFANQRKLLSSLDSADSSLSDLANELISFVSTAAELLLHHGIQLFCLWKFRKTVAQQLRYHIPFDELYALLKYNLKKPVEISPRICPNTRYCLEMLSKVNGSFAAMIIALPDELREPTCVFYLILRALFTIESDRTVSVEQRKEALANFHNHLLDKFWSTRAYGDGYSKELLANFDRVTELYLRQDEKYRDIIKDSTRRMGQGMSDFLDKEIITKQDYDLYCHYIAGMVGISLTAMYGCGSEAVDASKGIQRANNLGLFLQKTNLIYESCQSLSSPSGRVLLPRDILSKFVDNAQDLQNPRFSKEATSCLNELIIDAFNHLHSSLEYMFFIKDPAVFNFYAIPLVLAAATLAECFGNPGVFQQSTKIRKGLAARIFLEVKDFKSICSYLVLFINSIDRKIKKDDPNAEGLRDSIMHLKEYIDDMRWVDEMTPHKRSC